MGDVKHVFSGITDIEWRSKNHFLSIIYFGFNIKFYINSSNTSLFIYKPEKINLISIGLFGITTSSIFIKPLQIERTVKNLVEEKAIGWFQGRMEFGPRALGNRSIIADARSKKMQKILNLKVKFRESFRPFAP